MLSAVTAVCCVAIVGCSSDADQASDATAGASTTDRPAASGSADTEPVAATMTTATTETIASSTPLSSAPAGDLDADMRQLRIPGGPDWLVAADDGVWVKIDRGELVLIDPAAMSVVAQVEVEAPGDGLCQGIGIGFDAVWTCSGTDVVRVDADSREVVSRLALNKAYAQGHLIAAAGRLWVLTGTGDTLVGVDPSTERVITTIDLPIRGTDLAADEAGLWVISTPDDRVVHVDADTGAILADTPLDGPVSITTAGGVWVAGLTESVLLDPATGAVARTIDTGAGSTGSIATDGTSVWIRNVDTFLTEFDGTTGEVLQTYASDATSGGDMIVAFGHVWTTAFDDATLFAIPVTR